MKKRIKYTDEPMGAVRVVSDFLPSPEELALKDETIDELSTSYNLLGRRLFPLHSRLSRGKGMV